MRALLLAILFVSAAPSQDLERTFQLKNISGASLQELATTFRTVVDVRTLSVDNSASTLTLLGSSDQIALSEWLIPRLDVPPGTMTMPQKYLFAGNANDVVEIFEMRHAEKPLDMQEMLTNLRTVARIDRMYQASAQRLFTMRADANHIAVADFLIQQLDTTIATRTSPTTQSFQVPGDPDNSVMVYALVNPNALREILPRLLATQTLPRLYQRTGPGLITMYGNSSQLESAQRLIAQLDAAP